MDFKVEGPQDTEKYRRPWLGDKKIFEFETL